MAKIYILKPVEKYQQNDFEYLAFEKNKQDIPKALMKENGFIKKAQFNSVFDYLIEVIWENGERSDYYVEEKELIK